jgi:hypothetical protein
VRVRIAEHAPQRHHRALGGRRAHHVAGGEAQAGVALAQPADHQVAGARQAQGDRRLRPTQPHLDVRVAERLLDQIAGRLRRQLGQALRGAPPLANVGRGQGARHPLRDAGPHEGGRVAGAERQQEHRNEGCLAHAGSAYPLRGAWPPAR